MVAPLLDLKVDVHVLVHRTLMEIIVKMLSLTVTSSFGTVIEIVYEFSTRRVLTQFTMPLSHIHSLRIFIQEFSKK